MKSNKTGTYILGSTCQIIMGQAPPSELVNSKGIGHAFLQGNAEFGSQYPTHKLNCLRPRKTSKQGDILISVRAPAGDVNLADQPYGIGRGLAAIHVRDDVRNFIYQVLIHRKNEWASVSQGSTFKAISSGDLRSFKLPVFTKIQKERIAKLLDSIDTAIEKTQGLIDQSSQTKIALREQCFSTSKLSHLKMKRLDSFGALSQGVAISQDRKPVSQHIAMLRVANVHWNKITTENLDHIEIKPHEVDRYTLKENDILFVEGHANPNELGRCAIVNKEQAGLVCQNHLFFLRLTPRTSTASYIVNWLQSYAGRSVIRQVVGTSSGLHTLAKRELAAIKTPFFPQTEQKKIVALLDAVDVQKDSLTKRLNQLKRLKTALSQKMFS